MNQVALLLSLALWAGTAAAAELCPLYDPDNHARPPTGESVVSAAPPVRVHYCHPSLRDQALRLLAHAVRSYRAEVGGLGFAPPQADGRRGGGPELDVYLVNLGRGGRAQANDEPATPAAPTSPGYVVIDYRTPEARDFLASYVAHEMNHVLQYAMGRRIGGPFMEATAAYVDDLLYPEADILPAMVADFQREPHRPIHDHDANTCYDYGAALFASYLVQRHGLGLLRQVFLRGREDYLASLAEELSRSGQTMEEALREFARWRVRTGRYHHPACFPGGQRFPEVAIDQAVSAFRLLDKEGLVEVRPTHPPQELGTAYLSLDLTTPLAGLEIEVRAAEGPGRLAVDLLGSDDLAPLGGCLLQPGQACTLRAVAPRPGMRLWLAVTNLGQGPPRLRPDPAATAHSFVARFRRLPE